MAVRGGGAASTRRKLRRRVGCGICKALTAAATNNRRPRNHIGMNQQFTRPVPKRGAKRLVPPQAVANMKQLRAVYARR